MLGADRPAMFACDPSPRGRVHICLGVAHVPLRCGFLDTGFQQRIRYLCQKRGAALEAFDSGMSLGTYSHLQAYEVRRNREQT